jgi:hypothetical protein
MTSTVQLHKTTSINDRLNHSDELDWSSWLLLGQVTGGLPYSAQEAVTLFSHKALV